MTTKNMHENGLQRKTIDFDGHPVTAVRWGDRWAWRAAEAGTAIGYEQGRYLVDKIRGEWAEDFRAGVDFDLLRGAELAQFQSLLDSGDSSESRIAQRGARSLLILYPSGIDRALILSRTEKGRRLRDLLVDHILPQLRETGTAKLPGAPELSPQILAALHALPTLVAQNEVLRAEVGVLRDELASVRTELATGVVGREVADREILTPLRQISLLYGGTPGEARRHRRRFENQLRSFLGFAGPGSGWAFLPRTSLAFAQRLLGPWMADAVEVGAKRSRASQQPELFGLHEPGRPMRVTRSPAN